MEKTNSTPSGAHDEIAVAKEPVSRPYSEAEPHEKADDEVSVSDNLLIRICDTLDALVQCSPQVLLVEEYQTD